MRKHVKAGHAGIPAAIRSWRNAMWIMFAVFVPAETGTWFATGWLQLVLIWAATFCGFRTLYAAIMWHRIRSAWNNPLVRYTYLVRSELAGGCDEPS